MTDLEEIPALEYAMPRLTPGDSPIPSRQGLVVPSPLELVNDGPREKGKTRFLIVHMTQGRSALSSIGHLQRVRLSYNYIIERTGLIYRCAPHTHRTRHAGESTWHGSDGNTLNDESVGVSLANINGLNGEHEPVGLEQYLSLMWLSAFLVEEYEELKVQNALGHLEVSPRRRFDPDAKVFCMKSYRTDLVDELHRRRKAGIARLPAA